MLAQLGIFLRGEIKCIESGNYNWYMLDDAEETPRFANSETEVIQAFAKPYATRSRVCKPL